MPGQQTTHTSASRCYYCGHTSTAGSQQCAHCGNILLLKQRYRLLGVLGQGGFGVVLEALDARLNRRCAIKRVYASSLEEQKQIQNEVDILSQHASHLAFIPTIYDTWVEQAHTFIVMEYIAGPTLDQTAQPWTAQPIKELLLTMLPNLARLHAAGIVHRDLKPQNIKHTPQGRSAYMLLDFGIAKRGGVTSVKALSPDFAPPEQAQGLPTDARADIYGLAATAYFLLTGLSPLQARIQANGHLPPPAQFVAGLSPHLERILLHMLEPDPARRPPHARAVLALLGSSTPPQSSAPPVATANDWQAPPTIPATPRHPRIGRPPPAPPRRSGHGKTRRITGKSGKSGRSGKDWWARRLQAWC
jgi:serine/threonine-protein kinase